MKLLVTTYMQDEYKREFEQLFDEVKYVGMEQTGRILTEDELIEELADADAIVVEFDPMTRRVLESAKNLKMILSVRTGVYASVDTKAAEELGIPIMHVNVGRNPGIVAEFVIGMMIAVSRYLALGNYKIKTRQITDDKRYDENGFCKTDVNWVGSTPEKFAYLQYKGPTFVGKTLGIIGYGAIGSQVAKRAAAFDMKLIAYDPFVDQSKVDLDVTFVDLDTLLKESDFVTIHMPVNDGTRNILSAEKLSLMKKSAYLLNAARGALVDYDKLIDMLQKKELAGAAIDVYPFEPLPADHPLLDLDNVVLTPHIAGCTYDQYHISYQVLLPNLKKFLNGEKPDNLYNPKQFGK